MTERRYPKLLIETGPSPGLEMELIQVQVLIGREPGLDLVIPSPSISRRHSRVYQQGDQYFVEDLGSSNGTFLNGERLEGAAQLHPGDVIALGRAIRLKFVPPLDQQATLMGTQSVSEAAGGTLVEQPLDNQAETLKGQEIMPRPLQPPSLVITLAGEQPQTYSLERQSISLGRSPDNDIVLPSKIVSRHHAVIEEIQDGYQLRALAEAANPVLFEGRPVEGVQRLHDGDLLRIGSQDPGLIVSLSYHAPAEAALRSATDVIAFGEKNSLQLGRDPSNDVILASPTVSRFHALVERVGQRYRVSDLHSSNGTFVNDQRIEGETWIKAGDSLRIGPHRFVLGEEQLSQITDVGGMQVEVLGLNKWVRSDLNLLKNISLLFKPREFIVVVGQSGGGKSTLLDAIAGFRPATQGKVLVNDVDIYRNFDVIRNEIGFVPQKDIIHMELTVYQALDYAAQLRMPSDTTPQERRQRVMEVLQDLDLLHRKDVQISGLSGGQQKRVSIGVELLTKPGLFFLDEPSSGLDPGTETALMHLMRRLADQGRTIVLITHATKNVMLADKVVFLARGGYLAWFGPPDEALRYFDQYRSERDRHARSMEFDEIYAILDDPSKGSAEEWARRYQEHSAYQQHIIQPLQALGRAPSLARPAEAETATATKAKAKLAEKVSRRPKHNRVSGLRQFLILSSRNVKILTRDRASLILMLASAPVVALLDVALAIILGRDLFDFQNGDIANALTSLFQPVIFAIMVGALAQMREFVKEGEIYRRERLVNLKVLPYVLSKIWVASALALYQAATYTIIHYLAFKMPGGLLEFGLFYVTLVLATLAGMMLGLLSSAFAPNANTAPLIVILLIIPQVVLGGALIPVPQAVSAPTSSRWAFEAIVGITGIGSDVAADACWQLPADLRDAMTLDEKTANQCRCMGVNVLKQSSCNFPGLGAYYDPAIDAPEPVEPQALPNPPAEPEIPPAPPEPADKTDQVAIAQYLQTLQQYQATVEKIQTDYKTQIADYQANADLFKTQATTYQKDRATWEIDRNAAVGKAEAVIGQTEKNFGWAFIDKNATQSYLGHIVMVWAVQGLMILVFFLLILFLISRKDRAR